MKKSVRERVGGNVAAAACASLPRRCRVNLLWQDKAVISPCCLPVQPAATQGRAQSIYSPYHFIQLAWQSLSEPSRVNLPLTQLFSQSARKGLTLKPRQTYTSYTCQSAAKSTRPEDGCDLIIHIKHAVSVSHPLPPSLPCFFHFFLLLTLLLSVKRVAFIFGHFWLGPILSTVTEKDTLTWNNNL